MPDDRTIRIRVMQMREPKRKEDREKESEREREMEIGRYVTERGGDVTVTVTILAYRSGTGGR